MSFPSSWGPGSVKDPDALGAPPRPSITKKLVVRQALSVPDRVVGAVMRGMPAETSDGKTAPAGAVIVVLAR